MGSEMCIRDRLHAALKKAGVDSELQLIEDAGHAWPLKTKDFDLRSDVVEFFNRHLKKDDASANSETKSDR